MGNRSEACLKGIWKPLKPRCLHQFQASELLPVLPLALLVPLALLAHPTQAGRAARHKRRNPPPLNHHPLMHPLAIRRLNKATPTSRLKMDTSSERCQMDLTIKPSMCKTKTEPTAHMRLDRAFSPQPKPMLGGAHGAPSLKGIADRPQLGFKHER